MPPKKAPAPSKKADQKKKEKVIEVKNVREFAISNQKTLDFHMFHNNIWNYNLFYLLLICMKYAFTKTLPFFHFFLRTRHLV